MRTPIAATTIAYRFITVSLTHLLVAAANFTGYRRVVKVTEAGPMVGDRRAFGPREC
jgi:hypothetical protein